MPPWSALPDSGDSVLRETQAVSRMAACAVVRINKNHQMVHTKTRVSMAQEAWLTRRCACILTDEILLRKRKMGTVQRFGRVAYDGE